ncbi:hypothetical protein [Moorena producens]|uniref:hypothetical protein n=1 Tax=Moorena producens TaxID=1155739 RepID=UPI003C737FB3
MGALTPNQPSHYYSLLPIPDSRFPIPDSRLPTPDSRFPIPYSRFPLDNVKKAQIYDSAVNRSRRKTLTGKRPPAHP